MSTTNATCSGYCGLRPLTWARTRLTSYMVQRMMDDGDWETLVDATADIDDQTAQSTHADHRRIGVAAENDERTYHGGPPLRYSRRNSVGPRPPTVTRR